MHSVHSYFHRDLKPENLLEFKGTVKIADFGLAKLITSQPPFTEYVSTRWYRSPELILKSSNYGAGLDIWALGCIMAELLCGGKPLFPGKNENDQMNKIMLVMGRLDAWPQGQALANKIGYTAPPGVPRKLANRCTVLILRHLTVQVADGTT